MVSLLEVVFVFCARVCLSMSKVAVALELGELQTLVRVVVCFRGGGRRWHKQEEEGETGSAARVCEMGGLQ